MKERSQSVNPEQDMKITIYCDGGSKGNPGKGYGSYEIKSDCKTISVCASRLEFGDNLTSNQAEYLALIAALNRLLRLVEGADAERLNIGEPFIEVHSDSKLMVQQVMGYWRCKVPHIRELRFTAVELLRRFKQWRVHWHPRDVSVKKFGH